MSYKAIIFDLDGTLINTLDDLASVSNQILSEKGFPTHSLNSYRYFVGDGAAMLIQRVLPDENRDEKTIQYCLDSFLSLYNKKCGKKAFLYDGIPGMLTRLTEKDIKMAILSNKPHNLTIKNVGQFFSDWNFEAVFGQREGIPKKPNSAGALEIAEQLSMDPSDFIYLGDTAVDMKTAVSAGMFPVGALWGFRDEKELRENGAMVLAEHPLNVLEIFDN